MKPQSLLQARDARRRDAEVIKAAARTPQGRALIDLVEERHGYPVFGDSSEKNHLKMGAFEVTRWLAFLEKYDGLDDG